MHNRIIDDDERLARLRLIRSDNVGAITWHRLMTRFGSAVKALDALPDLMQRGGARAGRVCDIETAQRELSAAQRSGLTAVFYDEPAYSERLAQIDDAPPLLYVGGSIHLLNRPAIAVVGARNASANGRTIARDLAQEMAGISLGDDPMSIVSGLARGIDTAAHEGALAASGVTVAVMAGGADHVYPRNNESLYQQIIETGAVVSEMPPGLKPQARHFPRRNRIVSGLSLGVVVVEAAARSGSLITARMALEQGREVFAVPGSPRDPRCHGTNSLIRTGATLTQTADDIVEVLAPMLRIPQRLQTQPETASQNLPDSTDSLNERERQAILDCSSPTPVTVDEIVRQCQVTASVVQMVLLELELAGRLERQPGNRVAT
ncbi:MAG: DNA-processing protein DprA, partial [Alphaproteobacteria bacterium]